MRRTDWQIDAHGEHTVSVEHGFWSGKVIIRVDNAEIFQRSSKLWDTGMEHRFDIGGVPCIVRIICRPFGYTYELWVDGKLV